MKKEREKKGEIGGRIEGKVMERDEKIEKGWYEIEWKKEKNCGFEWKVGKDKSEEGEIVNGKVDFMKKMILERGEEKEEEIEIGKLDNEDDNKRRRRGSIREKVKRNEVEMLRYEDWKKKI